MKKYICITYEKDIKTWCIIKPCIHLRFSAVCLLILLAAKNQSQEIFAFRLKIAFRECKGYGEWKLTFYIVSCSGNFHGYFTPAEYCENSSITTERIKFIGSFTLFTSYTTVRDNTQTVSMHNMHLGVMTASWSSDVCRLATKLKGLLKWTLSAHLQDYLMKLFPKLLSQVMLHNPKDMAKLNLVC